KAIIRAPAHDDGERPLRGGSDRGRAPRRIERHRRERAPRARRRREERWIRRYEILIPTQLIEVPIATPRDDRDMALPPRRGRAVFAEARTAEPLPAAFRSADEAPVTEPPVRPSREEIHAARGRHRGELSLDLAAERRHRSANIRIANPVLDRVIRVG